MSNEVCLKVYVDTCILSNLLDYACSMDFGSFQDDMTALDKVCNMDFVELVTTEKTLDEIIRTQDDTRRTSLKVLFKIMTKISSAQLLSFQPLGFNRMPFNRGGFNLPDREEEDPLFSQLKSIFDEADAEHIFQAVKRKCEFFLTVDRKTILNRVGNKREKVGEFCPEISFVDPQGLLRELKSRQ